MAIGATIVGNDDGTVTYTVTGIVSGVADLMYAKTTDLDWITLDTVAGNGTYTRNIQSGTHWFCVGNPAVAGGTWLQVTSPVMVCAASNEQAVFKRIIDTVVAELQSLATAGSLPGLDATKVERQDVVFISNLPFDVPGIIVAPGAQEEDRGGTNARDDLGYPVQVIIVDSKWAKDPDPDSTDIDYLLIRERIRRHFQHRRLASVRTNVPESYTTNVTYEGILDHQTTEKGLMRFGSYLQLNFCTREPRGA
jgi:hypothetical protein